MSGIPATLTSSSRDHGHTAAHAEVAPALHALSTALLALFDGFPKIRKAADVAREFELARHLAWKLWRIAKADKPLEAVPFLLSQEGYEKLLRAARRRGCVPEPLEAVRVAALTVADAMERHAGDRTSLEIMVNTRGDSTATSHEIARRKATFLGNSEVFGVQAAAQYRAHFFGPALTPGLFSMAKVGGTIALRRMRPNVVWPIGRATNVHTHHRPETDHDQSIILDPRSTALGIPIPVMLDFSSSPLPPFFAIPQGNKLVEYQVGSTPVGSAGDTTVFTGQGFGNSTFVSGDKVTLSGAMYTPSRWAVQDMLFESGAIRDDQVHACLVSDLGAMVYPRPEAAQADWILPTHLVTRAIPLMDIATRDAARCDHVPRVSELIRAVCASMHWNPARFTLYRTELQFPPIPTTLRTWAVVR